MSKNYSMFAKTPQEIANEMIDNIAKAKYVEAVKNFDKTMSSVFPADKLETTWKQLIGIYGNLQTITDEPDVKNMQSYVVVIKHLAFEKDKLDAVISIDGNNKIAGLRFMPVPKKASDYIDADYVDKSKFNEISIKLSDTIITGKLTLPNVLSGKKVPAVVLVHGSGPSDEDETIYDNKPFRDIAYGLASQGIAVLRYNKRTLVDNSMKSYTMTDETVVDAVDAVNILHDKYADKISKIYVLGHSQGGYMLPRIAKRAVNAAGFICLMGNTRSLEDVLPEQTKYLYSLQAITNKDEQIEIEKYIKDIELSCKRVRERKYDMNTPADSLPLGFSPIYYKDLKDYNPTEELKSEVRPMLFIQGERDYQVTTEDFNTWKKNLTKPSNTFVLFPDLNHFMQSGTGKATPSEYAKKQNVAKEVIDKIAEWIKSRD